jgi:hypothetical protein
MSSSIDTTPPETAPGTRADIQWVSFVASLTAFVVWLVKRACFGPGDLPVEVSGVIQLGVPLLASAAAAEWRWHIAKHRPPAPASPPVTPGQ